MKKSLFSEENIAILGLTNVFSIAIKIKENGESLVYQYNNDYNIKEASICYENDRPYFVTEGNVNYYIDEFVRV